MHEWFFNCDWGTTRLRLRAVSTAEVHVAAEHRSLEGVAAIAARLAPAERTDGYRAVLAAAIAELVGRVPADLAGAPIVVSGMASSSLGWQELPYARVPLPLAAAGLVWRELEPITSSAGKHRVVLVSGARSDTDVLRGEETEALGLLAMPAAAELAAGGLVIKPGTHSKHLRIASGRLLDFRTFMTGELFDVLARHSILQHSVAADDGTEIDDPPTSDADTEALVAGVRTGRDAPLSHALFRVRTRQLLDACDARANRAFLSGVLIGSELAYLTDRAREPIVLCATGAQGPAYETALRALGLAERLRVVRSEQVELLSARGQAALLGEVLASG